MDERWKAYLERRLVAILTDTRAAEEGRGGLGWLTATELSRRAGLQRLRILEGLEACPDTFRELDEVERRILGAKHNARVFGLRTWPPPA